MISKHGFLHIVDLGSGSGGAMPNVIEQIREHKETSNVQLTLTDLYPNKNAIEKYKTRDDINYLDTPVNATDFQKTPHTLHTMINCFHHMPPNVAKNILQSAVQSKSPLFIYELADNKIPFVIWLLMFPIGFITNMFSCMFLTLFLRPIRPLQLLVTYIIPIIPICFAWDGLISYTRIYTFEDLDKLLQTIDSTDYSWKKSYATSSDEKTMGIYLLGIPKPKK